MISLSKIKEDDLYLLGKWRINNKFLNKHSSEIRLNLEKERIWFNKIMTDELCKYWIIDINNIKIGVININNIDIKNKECCLEYSIQDIHFKERDIISTIIFYICDYIFNVINLDKIYCNVHRLDKFNIKLLKRIGNEIKDSIMCCDKDLINICIDRKDCQTLKDKDFLEKIFIE